jgi:hypothetical protein
VLIFSTLQSYTSLTKISEQTLFSMTMFDWHADSGVVSKWIWVYAALTLPVTFILLITWLLFMKKNGLRHKAQELAVEETYGDV